MNKTALVFAGQGAQVVGMGRDLIDTAPDGADLFARASDVLGYDLAALCFDGPMETLTRTDRCQPAIFVVSAVCASALRAACPRVKPLITGGLSLGEWTALYDAGALGFEDTVRILDARGQAMQQACDAQAGGMISVLGLPVEALESVARDAGVEISNINAADQVVLSGPRDAMAQAAQAAQAAGARKVIPLNVAGAYHSRLMAPAAETLAGRLASVPLRTPDRPVLSNVSGGPHAGDPEAIKAAMVDQVVSTVRWLDNMRYLLDQGVTTVIECGPGKVLSTLVKRLDRNVTVANIQDQASLASAVDLLSDA